MSRTPRPHTRRRAAGFTLIEALLAGVILALVGVTIGGATTVALHTAGHARGYERAAELLDQTMTRIDLIGPERVMTEGPTQGTFDPPYENYRWNTTISPLTNGYLYEVTVRVTWPGPAGVRSAEVATRLHDAPGSRDANLYWEDL